MPSDAIEPPSDCGWPLSHRDKHKGSWCSCVCHLIRGHRGAHRCERESPLPRRRFVWSDAPERHLKDWAATAEYRTVDYAEVHHTRPDGTHTTRWTCQVTDHEPCQARGGSVEVVIHGTGTTRAAAADQALTQLQMHTLEQARARQQETT